MGRHEKRSSASMLDALFPRSRQRVLGLLFGQPSRSFAVTELIRLAKVGSGAVQRELDRFVRSGLVIADGTPKRYRTNATSPLHAELVGIFEKTGGITDELRRALAPLASKITFAVLYGSVAKEADRATSDIDVLLVSDELTLEEVFAALERAEKRLGRTVSPTLYTSTEFQRRRRSDHPFLTNVLGGKHTVLFGSEDEGSAR